MDAPTLLAILTPVFTAISTLFVLYVRELQRQIRDLKTDNEKLETELKATNAKVEETVKAGNEATRQEMAQLRQTNAELVTALTRLGASA